MGREHCEYCAYYASKRTFSSGIFLGSSVRVEKDRALCTKTNKEVRGSSWCRHFTACAEFQKLLNEEENKRIKKENEAIAKKAAEENEKARREEARIRYEQEQEIRSERAALKKEREEFEYQQWYAGLSKAEKKKEDLRVAEEQKIKQEEARKRAIERKREHEEYLERERVREIELKKAKRIEVVGVLLFVVGIILLIVGLCADNKKNPLGVIVPTLLGTFFMLVGLITFVVGYRKSKK